MYLRRLHIKNLKRLRSVDLDFTDGSRPRMWTVLIGENGTAKTSILQAIALAAVGLKEVGALAGTAVKHLRDRRAAETMKALADFEFGPSSKAGGIVVHPSWPRGSALPERLGLRSEVQLQPDQTSFEASSSYLEMTAGSWAIVPSSGTPSDPLAVARSTNARLWFVAGYGIARALPDAGETPALAKPAVERLEPIFRPRQLASTGFSNHFLARDEQMGRKTGETSRRFARVLNEALKLGGSDLFPELAKLELRGHAGAKSSRSLIETDRFHQRFTKTGTPVAIPGVALSHGYQSTFAWIADLVGHVLLEAPKDVSTRDMEGLVLIDELDIYLHPVWQATIIQALRRIFPKIQFIVTTHSPIVLSAVPPHEVVRLVVEPESGDIVQGGWPHDGGPFRPGIQAPNRQPDPRTMTGGELYRTWFGLEGTTPNPLGEPLRQLRILSHHPAPTPHQKAERRRLEREVLTKLERQYGKEEARRMLQELLATGEMA
ncbi:MAG: AAA family ATPase [Myxococcales bacterium]|nr:AAA family ATPase [Myxococcales bacterium]